MMKALVIGAFALLVACADGSGSIAGMPGAVRSSMAVPPKRGALLYVSDLNSGSVDVLTYPGGKLQATLTGFTDPHGECVDGSGNVFIANLGSSQIFEYAHGGSTPIATLSDPNYMPNGCAIDPITGNLAVANISPFGSGSGNLAIYKHAQGSPHFYTIASIFYYYYCGYDDRGNLFVDGTDYHAAFALAEMRAGRKRLAPVTLNQQIRYPGGVQWDGAQLAVGDQYYLSGPSRIYEFSMKGTSGTLAGTTQLGNSCDVLQFWIDGKRVIAPNVCTKYVNYYAYPAGGAPTKSIPDNNEPVGLVVSQ